MDPRLQELLDRARHVRMTDAERATQRINFAYGNAHIENAAVTRDTIRRASERLNQPHVEAQ